MGETTAWCAKHPKAGLCVWSIMGAEDVPLKTVSENMGVPVSDLTARGWRVVRVTIKEES